MIHQVQPRRFHPARTLRVAVIVVGAFLLAWAIRRPQPAEPDVLHLAGHTMGTVYAIRIVLHEPTPTSRIDVLRDAIDDCLADVNTAMSLWDPDSELSRFNAHTSTEPFPISDEMAFVVRMALEVAERSDGAFDPTVTPLVNAWGFGPGGRRTEAPDEEHLRRAMDRVGYSRLSYARGALTKTQPDLHLDLGAIAKGYGVDRVAETLHALGFTDFLVEIGGDLYAAGFNAQGAPWRVGVDSPAPDIPPGRRLHAILGIRDAGVATSGDYRNFFRTANGDFFAHIIDPRTGRPVRGPISSVTVVAPSVTLADALATALFVLGPEPGLNWLAANYPEADALFLTQEDDGRLREQATPDLKTRTGYRRVDGY